MTLQHLRKHVLNTFRRKSKASKIKNIVSDLRKVPFLLSYRK